MYLIEILHQTTTEWQVRLHEELLYLIEILHQTTTSGYRRLLISGCILSKFYIKPQPFTVTYLSEIVVSYRNSTSNHNTIPQLAIASRLYLIEILHQTTTVRNVCVASVMLYLIEILHQTTTLNGVSSFAPLLYLIEILHQTTTFVSHIRSTSELYLIEILHQTTTQTLPEIWHIGCILSKFYIKPQLMPLY